MKILLVRFSSLGDVVLSTSVLEALRVARPNDEVHVLTKPAFREVFENHPGVTHMLAWDPDREGLSALARRIRDERYTWIVDLHLNLRTWALRRLVRDTRWCVYRKGVWRRRLAVGVRRPELLRKQPHVVERYLAALEPLGVAPDGFAPRVYPGSAEREQVRELLLAAEWDGHRPCVALAPGARWATKAWPEKHWRELISRFRREPAAPFPVLVGGADEAELCARILGDGVGANLAGRTGLLQTAAVLERCNVLVTNDSAPLHLATAVGTPVVALFGPTVAGFGFAPRGPADVLLQRAMGCRPCHLHGEPTCRLGHHGCLEELLPEQAMEAVRQILIRPESAATRIDPNPLSPREDKQPTPQQTLQGEAVR